MGWGPTVTEINHLLPLFEKIYHCAFLHEEEPPHSSLAYNSPKIEFIPLPPSGGKGLMQKLTVITTLPETLKRVKQVLRIADIYQFRAPTGIGLYMIPYLTFFERKNGWFKYAGNWDQKNAPPGYALQRWMLRKQSHILTINGSWPNQPVNVVSFDNPCLTDLDREKGKITIEKKSLESRPIICFVGNLTIQKGFDIFMDALENLVDQLGEIHVIGDGPLRIEYENKLKAVIFHGSLPKEEVHNVYLKCHFIVLPSLSEGFPKVIAEGMNFGCIPIVSDISGISQYIRDEENGFLIRPVTRDSLIISLKKSFRLKNDDYKKMALFNHQMASRFTFETYLQHLRSRIL